LQIFRNYHPVLIALFMNHPKNPLDTLCLSRILTHCHSKGEVFLYLRCLQDTLSQDNHAHDGVNTAILKKLETHNRLEHPSSSTCMPCFHHYLQ